MDKKTGRKKEKSRGNETNKKNIISLLFEVIVNRNKDATLKLLEQNKNEKEQRAKSIDAKILDRGFIEVKNSGNSKDNNPGMNFPQIRYFDIPEMPKIDYGALFSYLGNMFKTMYDDYKAFKYNGEGRFTFEHEVEHTKYERIIEKEMMREFNFFGLDHVNPEEKEKYNWDRLFGFRAAAIKLSYGMKLGALRMVPGEFYIPQNEANQKAA